MSLYILITTIKSTWPSLFGIWVSLHPWFHCSDSTVSAARAIGLLIVIWGQLSVVSILSCPLTVVSSILSCALHPACFKLQSKLCCPGSLKQHHWDGVLCHSVWMLKIAKTWLSAGSTSSSWNVHARGSSKCQTGAVNVLTTRTIWSSFSDFQILFRHKLY